MLRCRSRLGQEVAGMAPGHASTRGSSCSLRRRPAAACSPVPVLSFGSLLAAWPPERRRRAQTQNSSPAFFNAPEANSRSTKSTTSVRKPPTTWRADGSRLSIAMPYCRSRSSASSSRPSHSAALRNIRVLNSASVAVSAVRAGSPAGRWRPAFPRGAGTRWRSGAPPPARRSAAESARRGDAEWPRGEAPPRAGRAPGNRGPLRWRFCAPGLI